MRGGSIGMTATTALAVAVLAMAAPARAEIRDYPLAGFTKVRLDSAADVTIVTGDRFAVHADGTAERIAGLAPAVQGDTLVLGWRRSAPHVSRGRLAIRVTMPHAIGVEIKGAGRIALDRAEGDTVVAAIDGTGDLSIAAIRAQKTIVAMHGTGAITLAGTTAWIDARKSGVGSIDASKLAARGGVLTGSGIGSIAARVDGPVEVTLSGIGSIEVAGHPTCTIKRSGLGQVDCAG